MTTALILAAGNATRLGPIRNQWAKACVPVAGTTPLQFLLQRLQKAGVKKAWVNLHWQAEMVKAQTLAAAEGMRIQFLHEPTLLGTGGTLLKIANSEGQIPEIVVNAKMFTDFHFGDLMSAQEGTLVLHPASSLDIFGGFHYQENGTILSLQNVGAKPIQEPCAVFTGISKPHSTWLDCLKRYSKNHDQLCLIRHGLIPAMDQGAEVHALLHAGLWCEISTPERVAEAEKLVPAIHAALAASKPS
jgi:NDP-sugar pyrophosphorylase family protein